MNDGHSPAQLWSAKFLLMATAAGLVTGITIAYRWRRHPTPFPHFLRFFLRHPLIGRDRLHAILEPKPNEHLLEIGPGTGYYALSVAAALGDGTLDLLDVQQAMLDHTTAAARRDGLANLRANLSNAATTLPFESDRFDGAYLSEVIGEIPDQDAALREFRRVIKPGGRLVVGESLLSGDVHFMTFSAVRRRAEAAGFTFEQRLGSSLGYFARFRA